MFCEESFGEINTKDVELFQNGSVHEFYCLKVFITFGTSEYVSCQKIRRIIALSKILVGRQADRVLKTFTVKEQYANESCDEHAVSLPVTEMMLHVHHIFALNESK